MQDIICWREPDDTPVCSVPQNHVHYGVTGCEWGHGGCGPSNLALNILVAARPLKPGETGVRLRDGSTVSEDAFAAHEAFKWEFIAPMARDGGTIQGEELERWLASWRWERLQPGIADEWLLPLGA
jgi:hypothetical protein